MKKWENEYFNRNDSVSLTVSELIDVLKGFPDDMPVVGTYEGIYGDLINPVVDTVKRGRDTNTCDCLVFDVEYSGQ